MPVLSKVLFVGVLSLGSTCAFVQTGDLRNAPASALKMASGEQPPVFTETTLRDILGKEGLRYNLNKTDKEIEVEGDYSLLDKIFGPTSNNDARLALKKQARYKSSIPTEAQKERASEWLTKYGYSRFFPAYMDKASEVPEELQADEKAAKAAFKSALGVKVSLPLKVTNVKPSVRPLVSVPKVVAPKVTARPKVTAVSVPKPVKAAPALPTLKTIEIPSLPSLKSEAKPTGSRPLKAVPPQRK